MSELLSVPAQVRSYSPGGSSPNIPPNPPTTPVEDATRVTPSKLNVNAIPFVPSHVSVIGGGGGGGGGGDGPSDGVVKGGESGGGGGGDNKLASMKRLDFSQEATAKPIAVVPPMNSTPPKPSDEKMASNDKVVESSSGEPCNDDPLPDTLVMVGSLECDLVQTVGQSSADDALLSDMTRKGEGPCEAIEFYSSTRLSDDSGTGTSSVFHSEKSIPQSVSSSTSTRTNSLTENHSQNSQPESSSDSHLTPSHTPSTASQQTTPTSTTPTSSLPTSPTIATVANNNNRMTKSWASIVSVKTTTAAPSSTQTPATENKKLAPGANMPASSVLGTNTTATAAGGGGREVAASDGTLTATKGPSTQLKALGGQHTGVHC